MQKRIALGVEYNGAPFHGWQIQGGALDTIQGRLEGALSRVADHPVTCRCAGRTDRGVHATGQVVHFESDAARPDKSWVLGTNAHLPPEICVRWAREVESDFDARFSALSRRYLYLIYNHPIRTALFSSQLAREFRPLDEARMQAGARWLIGELDFTSFRAAGCQSNTPMRNVTSLKVARVRDLVTIEIEANAFLLHMVRNIAGVLMDVGAGARPPDWVGELLEARDRTLASPTADAAGLYLVHVAYPERFALPNEPVPPHLLGLAASDFTPRI